jgi:hypothetical protein
MNKTLSRLVALLLVPSLAFGQLSAQSSELRDLSESCVLSSELTRLAWVSGDFFTNQALALDPMAVQN